MDLNQGLSLANSLWNVTIRGITSNQVVREVQELESRDNKQAVRHLCQLIGIHIEGVDSLKRGKETSNDEKTNESLDE